MERAEKFGLLASVSFQLDLLEKVVVAAGQTVGARFQALSRNIDDIASADVDAWLVQLNFQNSDSEPAFVDELEALSKPVIYADLLGYELDASDPLFKCLVSKVRECRREVILTTPSQQRARSVWVLAASLGGPAALSKFLRSLCIDSIAEVALLYVQHIEEGYEDNLQRLVQRNNHDLQVFDCRKPQLLCGGCLYVVSPSQQIELKETGWLSPVEEQWRGDYRPSIDQVIAKVARRYGKDSGAILFSGMGDDGSGSCAYMQGCGGEVWAQEPDSCAVDSMPREAIKSGVVTLIATPSQLAESFNKRHSKLGLGNK